MTLYQIKPAFQALLRPVMFWLHKKASRQIRYPYRDGAFFCDRCSAGYFPQPECFVLLPIVLFIRMALNALDGMLARECNQQSRLGAILNESGDILSDIALYLPFMLLPRQ